MKCDTQRHCNVMTKIIVAGLLGLVPATATAYEIDTHAQMTLIAYQRSVLVAQPTMEALGLWKSRKRWQFAPIGRPSYLSVPLVGNYYDFLNQPPSRVAQRFDHEYSKISPAINRWDYFLDDGATAPRFIGDWLSRGAVREDDQGAFLTNLANGPFWGDPNAYQQLDTSNPINRFCNHFYDPVGNRALQLGLPLSLFACSSGEVFGSAVQWSLGSSSVDGAGSADAGRKNSFSILDAREAMWRALTGTDKNDAPVILANSRAGRDAYWATTFRALGGVIHNLQDMGQPQHTRNEGHPFGPAHLLEEHVNNRVLQIGASARDAGAPIQVPAPIDFGNYPVPMFATARQFFSTASGASSYSGLGLANYSNRSFFTCAANFGDGQYTQPDSNSANYGTVTETNNGEFDEVYLTRSVPDSLNPSIDNANPIKMVRESLLKEVIDAFGAVTPAYSHRYSIDRRVIDDQVSKLIPRAVSYSTGLINFFFRGSLDIQPTSDGLFGLMDHATGTGFKKLVLKVKNTTPAITDPVTNAVVTQQMNPGKFVAVVRFHRDLAFSNDLSTAIGLGACSNLAAIYGAGNEPSAAGHDPNVTTACREGPETLVASAPLVQSLDAGEEKELSFDFSASPISLAGVDYSVQVVFRGKLGYEDDAVATGFREMADPMFITRHNIYDYIVHGVSDSLNNNEFGADIPTPEFPGPVNFFRANRRLYNFGYTSDLKGLNLSGWSFFGLEAFTAFDYTQVARYTYTFGPRTSAAVATASAVPPAGFTRIAVLVPLWKPDTVVPTPPVRIERQRFAESAYMGESVDLWPHRHATQQVAWQAPMRGINAWHSDGYVWWRPEATSDFEANKDTKIYCWVGPRAEVQGAVRNYHPLMLDANNHFQVYELALRLTNAGKVYWHQNGPPPFTVDTQEHETACASSARAAWVPPPTQSAFVTIFTTFTASPVRWSSSYSPWDLVITTNTTVSPLEQPTTAQDFLTPSADAIALAASAKLGLDGITQTAIIGKAPTAVTIAQKYR